MALFEPGYPRRRIAGQLLWFLAWAAGFGIALWLTPNPSGHGTHTQLGLPPCPSMLLTSRPCPGCGLTTSFSASAHLRVLEAFHAHAFGPALFWLWTASAWMALYGFIRGMRFDVEHVAIQRFLLVLMAAFVVYGAVRMAVAGPLPGSSPTSAHAAKSAGSPPVCQNRMRPLSSFARIASRRPANALPV